MDKYRRDTWAVREFIVKTAVKLIIMIVVLIAVFMITQTPILTNNISMHQMENPNDWFVAMIMYQKFANAAGIFGNVYVIVTLGFIGWDGYKLAKVIKSKPTNETENEKENYHEEDHFHSSGGHHDRRHALWLRKRTRNRKSCSQYSGRDC